jgi:hypothetical protein
MITEIRNNAFSKILAGFMGLFLLNLSIDTENINTKFRNEGIFFNDQETIIELVVEKILGFENAFEEYDDYEKEDHTFKKGIKIDFTIPEKSDSKSQKSFLHKRSLIFAHQTSLLEKGIHLLDTPPPKI